MRIVLIDDNAGALGVLAVALRRMGHQVDAFADPSRALADLSKDTDLVVSDVTMPAIDGFGVAEEVLALLGNHLPRVLLLSGDDYHSRLETCPPSDVIGLMPKPICIANLSRVISLLAQARAQCPGTLGSFCPHVQGSHPAQGQRFRPDNACFTAGYATCPHYNAECGKALRLWVARDGA